MIHLYPTGFKNIVEIEGIQSYRDVNNLTRGICYALRQKYKKIVNIEFTTLIFDGVITGKQPQNLYNLIIKEKLGDVITSVSKKNPNSGHWIRVCVWHVDKMALSYWFKKNRRKREMDNA